MKIFEKCKEYYNEHKKAVKVAVGLACVGVLSAAGGYAAGSSDGFRKGVTMQRECDIAVINALEDAATKTNV